ncbi:MAG: hypothetical protein OEY70_13255 [Acidimicrobiia bacterium]|nr:hypothetical protein [Acidimicrobiia bacterium]
MKLMFTSGWPRRAVRAAKRMSQCRVISSPPPTATPSMAASIGLADARKRWTRPWTSWHQSAMPASSILANVSRSAPALK